MHRHRSGVREHGGECANGTGEVRIRRALDAFRERCAALLGSNLGHKRKSTHPHHQPTYGALPICETSAAASRICWAARAGVSSPSRTRRSTSARMPRTDLEFSTRSRTASHHHRPGPLHLLRTSAGVEFARLGEHLPMTQHGLPRFGDPGALQCAHRQHTGRHSASCGWIRRRAPASSLSGFLGLDCVVTVGLVHHDDVGEFEHALLDALKLVAGAGQGEEDEGVDHGRDRSPRTGRPDGLHQDTS